jgi:hypothetical protein
MSIKFKENAVCYAGGGQFTLSEDGTNLKCVRSDSWIGFEQALNYGDFRLNEPKQGDYLPKSELDTEQKYNDAVEVFGLFGFNFCRSAISEYHELNKYNFLTCCDDGLWQVSSDRWNKRPLTYNQLMAIGKLKRLMNKHTSSAVSKVNLDIERAVKSTINAELDKPVDSELKDGDKYIRTIYGLCGTPVKVDVYRVLDAFPSGSAAIDHAAKKVLCAGLRGHKDKLTDIDNAIESLQAERLLLIQKGDL